MKKRVLGAILLASMLLALVGCSTGNSPTSGSPGAGPKPAASAGASEPSDEKVSFSIWHSYVGTDQRAGVMQIVMGQFGSEHPEYEIDEQKIPRDQYQTKLKTQAAAEALPESFLCWPNAMTIEFVQAGLWRTSMICWTQIRTGKTAS
jgi:raffinose/stachyose/melibiose transport system substrate-binding protein